MASFEEYKKYTVLDVKKKGREIFSDVSDCGNISEGRFGLMTHEMTKNISIAVCDFILKTESLEIHEVDFYENVKLFLLGFDKK